MKKLQNLIERIKGSILLALAVLSIFYINPPGCRSDWDPLPKEESKKKKSPLESALDDLQTQTETLLQEALALAKTGDAKVQEDIEQKIEMYRKIASVTPAGLKEEKIGEIRKHQEYQMRLQEFEQQLKKDIFG